MKIKRFLSGKFQKKKEGKNNSGKNIYPDRMKYFGILKSNFDPLAYQKKCREEWDREIVIPYNQQDENSSEP